MVYNSTILNETESRPGAYVHGCWTLEESASASTVDWNFHAWMSIDAAEDEVKGGCG